MKSWNQPDAIPSAAPLFRRAEYRGMRVHALSATLATCFVLLVFFSGVDQVFPGLKYWRLPKGNGLQRTRNYEWFEITPSKELKFVDCYDRFQCAKLSLPLDYFNGTHPNETVTIAITKLPALVPVDDPRYGGPILLNPGGPGGPGAQFNLAIGNALQTIVDSDIPPCAEESDDAKYYDIIGFDPRGIGATEPRASCMPDVASSWSWRLRETEQGILGSSDASLGRLWSMSHAWGSSCKESMEYDGEPSILQYMTTASVARDMLEIIKKHATLVSKERTILHKASEGVYYPEWLSEQLNTSVFDPSQAVLNYWGFSYGTFLGSTFASMFPDRVGRFLLDGVVSSHDYTHSLGDGSLVDSAKAFRSFFTFCLNSDKQVCPLNNGNTTLEELEDRVQNILKSVYHSPIPLPSPEGPEVLTYSNLRELLFMSLYSPRPVFPFVAEILAAVEAGGDSRVYDFVRAGSINHVYSCSRDESSHGVDALSNDATFAILCSDGLDQSHVDLDKFTKYWDLLEDISPNGAIWALLKMRCASWKIKAVHKYQGKYGGDTAHPILFVSNTADPVTPLKSGRIMSQKFPNSGLLTLDTAGHCSLAAPSLCALEHIKSYFQTGALPPPRTLCVPPADAWSLNSTDPKSPFYDPSLEGMNVVATGHAADNIAQARLMSAGWELHDRNVRDGLVGFHGALNVDKMRAVVAPLGSSRKIVV